MTTILLTIQDIEWIGYKTITYKYTNIDKIGCFCAYMQKKFASRFPIEIKWLLPKDADQGPLPHNSTNSLLISMFEFAINCGFASHCHRKLKLVLHQEPL